MNKRRIFRPAPFALVALLCISATQLAFAQGQDVRLIGQLGGVFDAVDVAGNYAYIGEGPNLTILDVSITTAPVVVGRILLPPEKP